MKRASITEVKNGLSALLDQVKAGETVIITDRGIPVARIVPDASADDADADEARLERLERAGIIKRGRGKIDLDLIMSPPPSLGEGPSVVDLVIDERRSGW